MKVFKKISMIFAVAFALATPAAYIGTSGTPVSAETQALAQGTGYTKTEDVVYQQTGKYIHNWGAREEDCTFLSPKAVEFYTGDYLYENLSQKQGGTGQSDAPHSDLYKGLQSFMTTKHTYKTDYDETRDLYKYTDCTLSDATKLSTFYSGMVFDSAWGYGGKPWNREHTWPKSKCLGGKNGKEMDREDIMMLRPEEQGNNSSRHNYAYGENSGFYNPNNLGQNVHGDCARSVLYGYVRWGNAEYMWGSSGVIESLNILLKWMEEDPVDTWEMGRNDAVQSITGTRNVFVDYPEYAWQLFGKNAPKNMITPSGENKNGVDDDNEEEENNGGNGGSNSGSSSNSNSSSSSGSSSSIGGSGNSGSSSNGNSAPEDDTPSTGHSCEKDGHVFGEWKVTRQPTADQNGIKRRDCQYCKFKEAESIPKLGKEGCKSVVGVAAPLALLVVAALCIARKKEN